MKTLKYFIAAVFITLLTSQTASAAPKNTCQKLPSYDVLKKALTDARKEANGGFNLDMWATVVDRSGVVCAVAFSGGQYDSQWLGSRVISAQKANTANAFSLAQLSLSTANLYSAVQPGGSLFGLQASNPVNTEVAYDGEASEFGTHKDPMVGERIGGVNVFGGGLALYNSQGEIVGGIGVSGDSSCADHNIAWRARHALSLDYVPGGVSPAKNDQIIYDVSAAGKSKGGFGHVACAGTEKQISTKLVATRKVEKK